MFKRGGSYIDCPDWIKTKKTTIIIINKNDYKVFQYAVTVTLNHEKFRRNTKRIPKIRPFINKYNWEGINYPSKNNDCKKFEKNNLTIALNVLYERIYATYVLKHNSNREKQRRMASSCRTKIICVFNRNNVKTSQ